MTGKRSEFVVLVPQKHVRGAKSRLSSLLSIEARQELIVQLLLRTLAICRDLPGKSGFFLCGPEDFANTAAEYGADFLPGGAGGMRRDLTLASEDWRILGKAAMLVVSTDLPLLTVEDLQQVVNEWKRSADVVICPDRHLRGTNVLMVNEPEHFRYAFGDVAGPGSFALHIAQAKGTGLTVAVVENPRLGLDLDLPQDLAAFIAATPDDPIAQRIRAGFRDAFKFE